ncbi:MAG: acyl-CoA dehydrogenase family protein [Chloroflexi bacterium]|nr:acyl-CoA dehydrogenase family protein [Chloroflexota bacterium]
MPSLTLSAEQQVLVATARSLAGEVLRPEAARWDREERFPDTSHQALVESELLGLTVPQRYGGRGLGVFEACLVLEELARGCMASALIAQMYLNGPPRAIAVLGTEEQCARYLPAAVSGERYFAVAMTEPQAGSAGTDLMTTLHPDGDGYRLTGEKCYITGGDRADTVLVFCRAVGTSGPYGIGAVVVHRDAPGFADPVVEPKMGARGIAEATLRFDDVPIDAADVLIQPDADSKAGAGLLLRQFNPERCGNAAMCVGVADVALADAIAHTTQRRQFGRPIIEFQGLQWKIADMAVAVQSARLLVWQAALSEAEGFPDTQATAMAKLVANEMAQTVTNEALQLHGHLGYTRSRPLERYVRDVRGMALGGGTTEILRNIIARSVTGVAVSQRR